MKNGVVFQDSLTKSVMQQCSGTCLHLAISGIQAIQTSAKDRFVNRNAASPINERVSMQVLDNTVHKQNLNYIKISAKLLLKGMKFAEKKKKKNNNNKTSVIACLCVCSYSC